MGWMPEIIRGFFVAFGAMQTISNGTYVFREDGASLARKQHRELPERATDRQMKTKALCMLIGGILLLAAGLYAYFSRGYPKEIFIGASLVFAAYTLVEALYYRYWKTTGAFIASALVCAIICVTPT